ncbi:MULTISPECIES: bifunctional (p)ppGpp synthetase/guanosine-3',5'-bis(diphosphate) 3'-pyrophosphohydrolase [unclassified Leptolyngbya]|uniref:RelA/SpoT family protein n=1 Tax=unclassified Leptolyngbya TaxID=2650499 RepID=UPI00168273C1|nr:MULTISPECIES: bifunctional (p)ppGpp synthetase/guanosine-3',5'-bis(diphosphate) 3'-pyrophosphohydrolase [unclassified Leptolyngbya]MBD1913437.1 bifunctional (p)ppGpp synthetase/guanosine-3',5'-bis(diphosphate) 3'-pyrophosphohydrolase [Leptolyngbya sp. FACHB-8]MBD2155832.1 bifunctional (p)ppGpp synthetase/guanosine-3',5'-bis(diphosphate) 3'-pyrophosphohydrolase [Leptolyngbya sp. FACHB-16]
MVVASAIPFDIVLPDWLQSCLLSERSPTLEPTEHPEADRSLVCEAFQFAYSLHEGQRRASGEPYIAHPVAVAGLLRDLGGSSAMIAAGFLHDVVEDTDVTPEELEKRFGSDVRHLVEGVTKLSKFNFSSKTERQAENFRRMFLAMAQDIRVIVVKLADRLHNMRTLEHLPDSKRRRIAQETLDIFAPLANRLGIGRFKWELEDLSFKYLEPEAYRGIQNLVIEKRADREAYLDEAVELLRPELAQAGIKIAEINGRPKHLYGIYQKMQRQQKEFHEIYDITAIRIIVKAAEECYRSLAIVHNQFRPVPGRFKDYIGLPKPNRYQSLHTVVIGPNGRPIEVQIRTEEMHHIAEYGIAAHWKYKEAGHSASKLSSDDEKFTWLRQLLDWPSDLKDAQEYLDNIRTNLFDDEVFVFTPGGDVIALSQKATPVDFAYRIHTEVGNHCAGAKINGRMAPLETQLKNGDIVEIITHKNSHPSLDWLNFTVTAGARNRIRQWYKRSYREQNVQRGRDLLEKELGKQGFDALLKSEPCHAAAERCNYHSVDDLLAALGYGEITLNLVVNRLREEIKARQPIAPASHQEDINNLIPLPTTQPARPVNRSSDSPIVGVEGLLYGLAGCCNPIPGEPIIGIVTMGSRGISIHRQGCSNVDHIPGDRLIPVSWNVASEHDSRPHTYPVEIQIEVIDRVGVLKDILSRLSDHNINVRSAQVKTFPGQTAIINLGIDIQDHAQLERTFTQIRKMSDVLQMRRVCQVED